MNTNMGITDRSVRIIVALIIAVLYYMEVITGTLGLVLIIVAAIFLLTALFRFCPLYLPFGLSTKKKSE